MEKSSNRRKPRKILELTFVNLKFDLGPNALQRSEMSTPSQARVQRSDLGIDGIKCSFLA